MVQFTKATKPSPSPFEARIRSNIDKGANPYEGNSCWVWTGSLNPAGYGRLKINNRHHRATHVVYEMQYGPIPSWAILLHRCDNPPCVRPEHLEIGTFATNAWDRRDKCRGASGSRNGRAKITEGDVAKIKALAGMGRSWRSISRDFGITDVQVRKIALGLAWATKEVN